MPEPSFSFKLRTGRKEINLSTYTGEYRNLMELIRDCIYTEDFGDCGGMGRCGTCLVRLENYKASAQVANEPVTLQRAGVTDPNVRLSCQIEINEKLSGTVILICN